MSSSYCQLRVLLLSSLFQSPLCAFAKRGLLVFSGICEQLATGICQANNHTPIKKISFHTLDRMQWLSLAVGYRCDGCVIYAESRNEAFNARSA
jgi:hypothetical protein